MSEADDLRAECHRLYKRGQILEAWLLWVMENCDDSPEHNFGTDATEKIRALLRGEIVGLPE